MHNQNSIHSFHISCGISFVFYCLVKCYYFHLFSKNQSRGSLPLLLYLMALGSLQGHLNHHSYHTECGKHLKNYYLEVTHLIHFHYNYLLVYKLINFPLKSMTSIPTSFCSVTSFFRFENGVLKYRKKNGDFIRKERVKLSKFYAIHNYHTENFNITGFPKIRLVSSKINRRYIII